MNAVAYCRVSTNKDEQIDSLQAQQTFFTEYSKRNNYELVHIYADEGKSGTKMKNRQALIELLADASRGIFNVVLIKDVSRLARNTVDFLTSIRQLKSVGIQVIFVNYDMTTSESSEFMLTMLSAIAQEESANTSKRIKFGKKINAEKGRIPNMCYGYDKTKGDYFHLNINPKEAMVIRRIFDMYVSQGLGTSRIANCLNQEGFQTKRGARFSQNSITRILSNQIYIGKVINGKEHVEDFLTGKRVPLPEENWAITDNPELRIINEDTFEQAQKLMQARQKSFHDTGEKTSAKHPYSKLIHCSCCGYSFRQIVRSYKHTYVRWSCSGRNGNGTQFCPNKTSIDEELLSSEIKYYLTEFLKGQNNAMGNILKEFERLYQLKNKEFKNEKDLQKERKKIQLHKNKYMEMFKANVIDLAELQCETQKLNVQMDAIDKELFLLQNSLDSGRLLLPRLTNSEEDIQLLLEKTTLSNTLLKQLIDTIEVNEDADVSIHLKALDHFSCEKTVQFHHVCT